MTGGIASKMIGEVEMLLYGRISGCAAVVWQRQKPASTLLKSWQCDIATHLVIWLLAYSIIIFISRPHLPPLLNSQRSHQHVEISTDHIVVRLSHPPETKHLCHRRLLC